MTNVNLQNNTKIEDGTIRKIKHKLRNHLFKKSFFEIDIPINFIHLKDKFEDTLICFRYIKINFDSITNTTYKDFKRDEIEISIYLGNRHNPCLIEKIEVKKVNTSVFRIKCKLKIKFEHEMVGKNESFSFQTILKRERN